MAAGKIAAPLAARVAVSIEGRDVWIRGWLYAVPGVADGGVPVILLDTDLADNIPDDRRITDALYGDGIEYRLKQEIVLGIGGARLLHALGFRVRRYHLNEGHSALLGLELLDRFRFARPTCAGRAAVQCPPRAGALRLHDAHAGRGGPRPVSVRAGARQLGDFVDRRRCARSPASTSEHDATGAEPERIRQRRGRRHAEVSRLQFPGHTVHAITNGVHPRRWASGAFARLFDRHVPGWSWEPEFLVRADRIPDDAIWEAHRAGQGCSHRACADRHRRTFRSRTADPRLRPAHDRVQASRSAVLRPRARWRDRAERSFQIVLAGKAHPRDELGQATDRESARGHRGARARRLPSRSCRTTTSTSRC